MNAKSNRETWKRKEKNDDHFKNNESYFLGPFAMRISRGRTPDRTRRDPPLDYLIVYMD